MPDRCEELESGMVLLGAYNLLVFYGLVTSGAVKDTPPDVP